MDAGAAMLHAVIEGLCTVLPLSSSGHRTAVEIWLGTDAASGPLIAVARLGCAAAMLVVVRSRLGAAVTEGIRGIARPAVLQESAGRDAVAIVVGALVAAVSRAVAVSFASPVNQMPLVAGLGLLLTAAGLASTLAAPPPEKLGPSPLGAALVGLSFGLAVVPGMSAIGAAYVMLRWLGVTSWRAAEMAMLVGLPALTVGSVRSLLAARPELEWGTLGLAFAIGGASALLAAMGWRIICERQRTPLLGLWLVPLALAIIGYGRALPHPTESLPVAVEA